MRESLSQYATLLFKLYFDRRRSYGHSEFSYRILRGDRDCHRVRVAARRGTFCTTISLRRNTSDLATFEHVFANNAFNLRRSVRWREIHELYLRITRQGAPLILDLGANIGLASLYFVKNWPQAEIISVEPEANNYRMMCANLAGMPNVLPLHAAAASKDGAVRMVDTKAEAFAMRTEIAAHEAVGSIPALSMQSVLQRSRSGSIPFIAKIDIEGAEQDLFSKAIDWVERFPVIIIELHDWMLPRQGISANFLRVIARQDRDFVIVGENILSIQNVFGVDPDLDPSRHTA